MSKKKGPSRDQVGTKSLKYTELTKLNNKKRKARALLVNLKKKRIKLEAKDLLNKDKNGNIKIDKEIKRMEGILAKL